MLKDSSHLIGHHPILLRQFFFKLENAGGQGFVFLNLSSILLLMLFKFKLKHCKIRRIGGDGILQAGVFALQEIVTFIESHQGCICLLQLLSEESHAADSLARQDILHKCAGFHQQLFFRDGALCGGSNDVEGGDYAPNTPFNAIAYSRDGSKVVSEGITVARVDSNVRCCVRLFFRLNRSSQRDGRSGRCSQRGW